VRDHDERRAIVTDLGRLSVGRGLEIGPLDRPLASKALVDVRYADVFSVDILRDRFRQDPGVVVDNIPEIDFPLHGADGVMRSLRDAVADDAPYRWVLASHVIEHVPDLIAWLSDIADVLEDGGTLVLAIPDRRYSFDARRPQTTVGQVLEAHERGDTRPTVRAVYDHLRSAVRVPPTALWAGHVPAEVDLAHPAEMTDGLAERLRGGEYVDVHVWTFTPNAFAEQIAELARLKVIDLYVEEVTATSPDELEFYARLVRLPRNATPDQRATLLAGAARYVADDTVEPPPAEPEAPCEPEEQHHVAMTLSEKEVRLVATKRRLLGALRGRRGE
jgi:hypothetical protein